jgi:hypothetical protein
MRLYQLRYDVGRALRGCIVVLGLVALTGPSALSRDGGGGSQGGGEASASVGAREDGKAGTGVGASHGAAAMRGEATGGLGLTRDPATATGTSGVSRHGRAAPRTGTRGEGAFAMSPSDVTESFGSLTKQQQARVMQRCKDVIAKPGEADPNQLALCQTLAAISKR